MSIKFVVVDPFGKPTGEFDFACVHKSSRRSLDSAVWRHDQAIRRFQWYLARGDQVGVDAACDALTRLGCLSEALKRCACGSRPNMRKAQTLLSLWNARGLWSIPRSLGDDLAVFTDAVRYFARPYSGETMTLYRGQSRSRYEKEVFGIAWTARLAIAEQFASLRDTPGIVLKLCASRDVIIARVSDFISTPKTNPRSVSDFEDEYLVDPRALRGMVSIHSLASGE